MKPQDVIPEVSYQSEFPFVLLPAEIGKNLGAWSRDICAAHIWFPSFLDTQEDYISQAPCSEGGHMTRFSQWDLRRRNAQVLGISLPHQPRGDLACARPNIPSPLRQLSIPG